MCLCVTIVYMYFSVACLFLTIELCDSMVFKLVYVCLFFFVVLSSVAILPL